MRTPEKVTGEESFFKEDILDGWLQQEVLEWRPLGLFWGGVGTASIFWGLFVRPEFG